MHDLKSLRTNPEQFDANWKRRGLEGVSSQIIKMDEEKRALLTELQTLQNARKELSREIGEKRKRGENADDLQAKAVEQRDRISQLDEEAKASNDKITDFLATLPNMLDESVPEGKDESSNKVLAEVGKPRSFDFTPKQHFELGENLGMMDFQTASKISGSRFVVLRKDLAKLERALGQFMLDIHTTEFDFEETSVPVLVTSQTMYWTDKLPKFAEDSYKTTDDRWLIPTAEVPLTGSVGDQIMEEAKLPLRMTALSQCFRSEAGSAGRDVRGMLRQHQFQKCELVTVCRPEESEKEHQHMLKASETVLERLGIPFRRMLLCAGDTGFGAAKTFDLEAWMPGQDAWREVASISNTHEFQARRMNARYRTPEGVKFVHTLNGSGLAVGRVMIALMENYQTKDGHIEIPKALQPYMKGQSVI